MDPTDTISKGSILLVDDDLASLRVMGKLFTESGYEVAVAKTGDQALRMAAEGTFEILVCDLYLPDMDGLDLARRLKQRVKLLLSGAAEAIDPSDWEAAGCSACLSKPIEFNVLKSTIQKLSQVAA